jgi:hypothetical protein
MPPTGAYVNSSGWQYTTAGGQVYAIPKVKDWSMPAGISRIRESADYDHYFTLNVCDFEDPTITLDSLDPFALQGLSPTVFGTLVGTIRDAYNGASAGGGGKQIQLLNATLMDRSPRGSHRQYARASYAFCGTSADGVTSPLVVSAL